jgi:hypothetical protein
LEIFYKQLIGVSPAVERKTRRRALLVHSDLHGKALTSEQWNAFKTAAHIITPITIIADIRASCDAHFASRF